MADANDPNDIYRFPEFFDRLEATGALDVRDAVESETRIDGIAYHHRGVQVPAHDATFVQEPDEDEPSFSIEVDAVGPRKAWAVFDATMAWDVYLVLFEGGAAVAWMTDDEFEAEEADSFPSKAAAIQAGRFSFGAIFRFGPDWVELEEWATDSEAPALLQLGDGRRLAPESESEFYANAEAIPAELRPALDEEPPEYLGLREVHLSVDS